MFGKAKLRNALIELAAVSTVHKTATDDYIIDLAKQAVDITQERIKRLEKKLEDKDQTINQWKLETNRLRREVEELKEGTPEKWHIKVPGREPIYTATIDFFTDTTVVFKENATFGKALQRTWLIDDIEWLARIQ